MMIERFLSGRAAEAAHEAGWRDLIETRLNKTAGQRAAYGDFSEAPDAAAWIASRRGYLPEAHWEN